MPLCKSIDRVQLFNLLTNILGIYTLYFIAGIIHESLTKRPHYNRITRDYQVCKNTAALMLLPFFIAWIMAAIYNQVFLKQRVTIPHKNSAITAAAVVAATLFSLLAIQKTSFPVVIMFQSCSILPVVFIGVFCSRVHDPNLHLGPQKIIVALIITAGILTFQFADPQTRQRQLKQQFIGILFLVFHFVAEGFLPDLQAEIKVNFKPKPTEMAAQINKWCTIITLIVSIVILDAWSFLVFLWQHAEFTIDLILMSFVSGLGQFFIYRMIKQFKQHFVPFTISSRKILTATISIAFYGHETNWIQILGICIVLFTVFVQFMIQITKKDKSQQATNQVDMQLNQQNFGDDLRPSTGSNEKTLSQKQKQQIDQQKIEQKVIKKIQLDNIEKEISQQIEQSDEKYKSRLKPDEQIKKDIQQVKTVGSKGDTQVKQSNQ